ncbi:uncharacterized protein JN550_005021 [Neoarthrinium moseri]|uniref:uncharacterized protein n=1 Tax=Neoarthrinium moseri TaxID=1658444 RepID=UPI001FDDBF7F|nr:uncharacterized protein JN550_005021 [Neoarthrinium moseri]KAI1870478.1 hypothetical protein JN550_005021 [Neoarthrinium moseri]
MAASSSSSEFIASPPKPRFPGDMDPLRMHPVDKFKPPTAKTFPFSVSGLWKSNGNLMRWITEVPTVHHDMGFEPATYQNEKRSALRALLMAMMEVSTAARRPNCLLPGTTTNRPQLGDAIACYNPRTRLHEESRGSSTSPEAMISLLALPFRATDRSLPLPCPGPPPPPPPPKRLRYVFVGDTKCGKTSMLLRFSRGAFPEMWNQTQYELFSKNIDVDGKAYDLELWDTSGIFEYHQLSLLNYLTWDAIFICFSVNSDRKFINAQNRWALEVMKYCRGGVPVFLVGLKTDTRPYRGVWSPFIEEVDTRGMMAARDMGAVRYLECSAKTGEGVDQVFEESTRNVENIRAGRPVTREKVSIGLGDILCM